nr:uncharacterized protein LOC124809241 [Hydra vulgaris]
MKNIDEKFAANVLQEKFASQNKIILATCGTPLIISKGSIHRVNPVWTHNDMKNLKIHRQFTGRDISNIAKCIRVKHGRKSIESNLTKYLQESNKCLQEFFETIDLEVFDSQEKSLRYYFSLYNAIK